MSYVDTYRCIVVVYPEGQLSTGHVNRRFCICMPVVYVDSLTIVCNVRACVFCVCVVLGCVLCASVLCCVNNTAMYTVTKRQTVDSPYRNVPKLLPGVGRLGAQKMCVIICNFGCTTGSTAIPAQRLKL